MRISIVTPSFNQAGHLEQTLLSVLSQADSGLEYLVIDGGSTDGSREIIERHAGRLAGWCSEPDGGQYEAINKGFARSTGEVMGWINSSDLYLPWTLATVREIFTRYPEVQWISSLQRLCIREDGSFDSMSEVPGFSGAHFVRGLHGGAGNSDFIQQETCFWRRGLWEKVGGKISERYRLAGDFWLWGEFFKHSRCTGVEMPLAAFRFHGEQRSTDSGYLRDALDILAGLRKLPVGALVPGYQNLVRTWVPDAGGVGGRSEWKLDRHQDDAFLSIFRWWLDRSREAKWFGSKLTYLPLAAWKFARRGFRKAGE